jgi:hypothetical protein
MAEADLLPTTLTPLSIALLSAGYPPAACHGVARSTWTLARGLVEAGHRVHVVTEGERDETILEHGVRVHRVAPTRLRYESARAAGCPNLHSWLNHSHRAHEVVCSLKRDDSLDVVDTPLWHLDGLVTAVSGELPVAVRVVTAVKQIASLEGARSLEARLLGDLETRLLEMSTGIVSNSESSARVLRQVYALELSSKVHGVVSYGLVAALDSQVQPLDGREKPDPVVLYVGRLELRKGILDLFAAVPEVLREFPRVRFLLAGADNSRDDGFQARERVDYRTYFEKRYPESADAVRFLGFVPDGKLPALYRSCDVFVAPSLYESFGLIYLEAMNEARPVVGCNAGGAAEVIVDGETGLLVAPGDPQRLSRAIIRLLENPRERRELGLAGRRRLLDRFTHTRMAAGFIEVYQTLLGRR